MPNFDMEHLYKYFIGQLKMDQNILQNDYPTKKDLKNLYKKKSKDVDQYKKEQTSINIITYDKIILKYWTATHGSSRILLKVTS